MMEKIRNSFNSIASKQGSYSVGLTALVIAIVVLINLIVGQLPSQVRQIDISTNNIYEITDTSRELLDGLDRDVTFTVLADKSSTDERIRNFMDRYSALSSHISVEWIDPVLHPSALTTYSADSDTIVVSCDDTDRSTTVAFSDIITYDEMSYYTTGSATESEFDGEGQLSSAVNYVTTDVTRNVYYTSGHGESSLSSSVTDLLGKSSLTLTELNLMMASSIPEDCDLLLMDAPANDLSEDEVSMLTDYMDGGGHLFVILGSDVSQTPNLASFLETYGLTSAGGYIADMQRSYQGNYYYIFPELSVSGDMANELQSDMVLLVNANGLVEGTPSRDTITLTPFMTTSSSGYAVTEDGQSTQGTYVLGATATENDSRLTVISSESMIDETITSQFTNIENLTLFMNAVTANFDDIENLSIEPKSLQIEYNTMQYTGLIGLAAIVGIPVVFLLYGLRRWMKRRKA